MGPHDESLWPPFSYLLISFIYLSWQVSVVNQMGGLMDRGFSPLLAPYSQGRHCFDILLVNYGGDKKAMERELGTGQAKLGAREVNW